MPLPVHTRLMARTAEMLAMPHLACRRRNCRRKNAWTPRNTPEFALSGAE